jgi:aminoglycoside phosphotransferase (APT) family kinase protein
MMRLRLPERRKESRRMTRPWTADAEISPERARGLIESQFPILAPAPIETLGVGWDNIAFQLNGRWVFRFPRRQVAASLIEREARILPLLAPHLPVPIPVPAFVGAPEDDYPYPFAGYEMIAGETACAVAWSDRERADNAVPLARFLAALHTIPVDEATRAWVPGDEIGRTNLPKRAAVATERLRAIPPPVQKRLDINAIRDLMSRLAETPPLSGPTCWVHGDFYARHALADADRRLCGVIDWGDIHLGDPALDLSIAFSFLPPAARGAFRTAYGAIDAAAWDRARFRALHYGVLLTDYGADIGDDAIRAVGEYALRCAVW